MKFLHCALLPAALLAAPVAAGAAGKPAKVDFNRDVRPILSENCLLCHGPDAKHRKADLRLDLREGALADLGGYAAVAPGKPASSEMVKRISTSDKDDVMPPVKSGKKLTPAQIDVLRRWVAEGAPYDRHWSFVRPVRIDPAAARGEAAPGPLARSWPRNPIDHFVLARLEAEGKTPAPEADRTALIRRVTLDLTGLPPALGDVDYFLADRDPGAYERLVDRVLVSKGYGERWAKAWLDLARYADTQGYAEDRPRVIWSYRDWVIEALNRNMPFDQFTIEQLAGDLLPNNTPSQIRATAFHRNTLTNTEGGTDDEEFRNVAVIDRVSTTMQTWLGLTFNCAQCHDHKYDPFTQEEFFRLFAFFNQSADSDKYEDEPVLPIYSPDQQRRRKEWEAEAARLEEIVKRSTPELDEARRKWEADLTKPAAWKKQKPASAKGASLSRIDRSIIAPDGSGAFTIKLASGTHPPPALAVRVELLPRKADADTIISRIRVSLEPPPGTKGEASSVGIRKVRADAERKEFEADNVLHARNGWSPPTDGKAHEITLVFEDPLPLSTSMLALVIEHKNLGRVRVSLTEDARAPARVAIPDNVRALLQKPERDRSPADAEAVRAYHHSVAPELKSTRDQMAAVKKLLKPVTTLPVMEELTGDKRRKTNIQIRGNFLVKGKEVTEGVPRELHPFPKGAPKNRLGLAQWLVSPENPLTARVVVNRYWEQLFGTGLVRTSEDWGIRGEMPLHLELMDWLATELVAQKWDLKKLLRLMVTSATYRQSSQVTPAAFAADPTNRLLARGPRIRLSAEQVRDQALFVSGLLSPKMFGPAVYPPTPKMNLNAAFSSSTDWENSTGEDRYRRGIYVFWRRTATYPSMATFDAPDPNVCTVKRIPTNTPLQALVTMNDPVYMEASQALARRMIESGGKSPQERATYGFRRCLARLPSAAELERLVALQEDARAAYDGDPKAALAAATDPLGPAPEGTDIANLAAWTVVGNVLLNLDEMFLKR